MRTLESGVTTETLKQHNPNPWIWLYKIELEITTINTTLARLTSFSEQVTALGKAWYPFPISHQPIRSDSAGNLPQLEIVISNVRREFTRLLQLADGATGNKVTVSLVHKDHMLTADAISQSFQIRGTTATAQSITLRCEMPDFYAMPIPRDLFLRNRCRWRFKSIECGYEGSDTVCTKSLTGTNGCIAHGNDEANNGRPRLHPRNFGGFPALPRGVR